MTPGFQIKFTDEGCAIDGFARPDIPTVLGPLGIVTEISDYLRHLALDQSAPATTLLTYAKILREFWARLERDRRPWERVNDSYLRRWRDEMEQERGLKKGSINQKLRTVFAFYVWAEETGRLLDVVDLSGASFATSPISTKVGPGGIRSCPLVFKTVAEPNRHTPTDEEVDRLHAVLSGRHAVRDGLILAWAEQTALRRAEILSLRVEQIPSSGVIQDLYEREETYSTVVSVKGGRRCEMHVLPPLLEQTRDYIEFERAETLAKARSRKPGMRDLGALFLSDTGLAPKPNSISKQTAKFFKQAGIKDASLHRLRAVHLTRLAERYVDLVDEQGLPLSSETIVLKLKEAARWIGTGSLHRYIDIARSRRASLASRNDIGHG